MFARIKQYYNDLSNELPLIRTVIAVSFALIYATTIGYPLAHTTAIFTMMFIGPGKKVVQFKDVLVYPLAFYILGILGVYIGYVLLEYVLITLLVMGIAVFWSFRLTQIPPPARILFLIFLVLLPLLSMGVNGLGEFVLLALIQNLFIALVIVKIVFLLIPVDSDNLVSQNTEDQKVDGPPINLDKVALNGFLVLYPLLCYYYLSMDSDILTLVFSVLLAFDPFIAQSKKGAFLVVANIFGGLIGIIAYQLLSIAPTYSFYIFLCISICFYFVINIYAGKKTSPIFNTSFNTFFIVMAAIGTSSNTASDKVWDRVIQIGFALIYVVIAYKIINHLNSPLKSDK